MAGEERTSDLEEGGRRKGGIESERNVEEEED